MKKLFTLMAVAAIACMAVTANANLLVNGDFEDDTFGIPGFVPGWTTASFWDPGWGTGAPMLEVKTGLGIFGDVGNPFSGTHSLSKDVMGHGNFHVGAYQTFATAPGTMYSVTGGFAGGRQTANDTGWWEVRVANGTTTDPDAAGTVIAKKEAAPGAQEMAFRETFANTFVATDVTSTIFVKWGRAQSADYIFSAGNFDNLVVEVVPEPGSMLALASGLAGMAGLILRKKA